MAGQVVMQGFIRRRIPIFVRRAITLAPALLVLAIGFNPTDALVAQPGGALLRHPLRAGAAAADRPRPRADGVRWRARRWLSAVCGLFAAVIIALNVFLLADLVALIIVRLAAVALGRGLPAGARRAAVRLDRPRARPADRGREPRTSTPPSPSARSTRSPTREPDWDWRLLVAQSFGHAAAAETVLRRPRQARRGRGRRRAAVREVREGRSEIVQMWGRPESVREEFRQRRAI